MPMFVDERIGASWQMSRRATGGNSHVGAQSFEQTGENRGPVLSTFGRRSAPTLYGNAASGLVYLNTGQHGTPSCR